MTDRSTPLRSRYDLIVIGAGAGGLVTAGGAAQLGARVLLVEQSRLGGECLYTGCVPSKAVLHVASQAGLTGSRWPQARAAVDRSIAAIEPHDSPERFEDFGVEVVIGEARFTGPRQIVVNGASVKARRFVIATGGEPAMPPISGLEDVAPLTNESLFSHDQQPGHLLIIGGGAIGCEMAQSFARLGSMVTIVTDGRLLPSSDPEAVDVLRRQFETDGVAVLENARVDAASGTPGDIILHIGDGRMVRGTDVLVAVGRSPRVHGYGLELAGVETSPKGIVTDKHLRTSNRRIYAVGDCRAGPRLTHAADQDARTVIQNALFPFRKAKDYAALPAAIYTDPELAQIGLTEAEARAAHQDVQVWRHDFDHADRSITEDDTRGFVKIVARGKSVLGVTIVGTQAGEMLALAGLLVSGKLSMASLAAQTIAYPTRIEALKKACEQPGQAALFSPLMRRLTRLFQWLP